MKTNKFFYIGLILFVITSGWVLPYIIERAAGKIAEHAGKLPDHQVLLALVQYDAASSVINFTLMILIVWTLRKL